jgi:hypothetical protein
MRLLLTDAVEKIGGEPLGSVPRLTSQALGRWAFGLRPMRGVGLNAHATG